MSAQIRLIGWISSLKEKTDDCIKYISFSFRLNQCKPKQAGISIWVFFSFLFLLSPTGTSWLKSKKLKTSKWENALDPVASGRWAKSTLAFNVAACSRVRMWNISQTTSNSPRSHSGLARILYHLIFNANVIICFMFYVVFCIQPSKRTHLARNLY